MTGVVKWFDKNKGYGFIGQDGGEDVYVHHTAIEGKGFKFLTAGDEVEFGQAPGKEGKGPKAAAVRVLSPGPGGRR